MGRFVNLNPGLQFHYLVLLPISHHCSLKAKILPSEKTYDKLLPSGKTQDLKYCPLEFVEKHKMNYCSVIKIV
jgi:hypothetical protein